MQLLCLYCYYNIVGSAVADVGIGTTTDVTIDVATDVCCQRIQVQLSSPATVRT